MTARRHNIALQLVQLAIEVPPFEAKQGADFLMQLLTKTKCEDIQEQEAAVELSALLDGHALAINQMAACMSARSLAVRPFLTLYKKSPKRLHRLKKDGMASYGYNYAIDTVWEMSFDLLDPDSRRLLGLFCFLAPDSIPMGLFEPREKTLLPELDFCCDEFRYFDANLSFVLHADTSVVARTLLSL